MNEFDQASFFSVLYSKLEPIVKGDLADLKDKVKFIEAELNRMYYLYKRLEDKVYRPPDAEKTDD